MRYYREHSDEGRDAESLADLRRRCAAVLSRELGREVSVEQMMAAIRFRAYPDAAPALAELRGAGDAARLRLELGLLAARRARALRPRGRLDGVVTSAAAGARKPDPAPFEAALEVAGCAADEALHVGDTPARTSRERARRASGRC